MSFAIFFCAVNVSFLHFSRKRYGQTGGQIDGRTDGRTDRQTDGRTDGRRYPITEMLGRI